MLKKEVGSERSSLINLMLIVDVIVLAMPAVPNKLNCTKMTHTHAILFPEIHFKHQQSFYFVGFFFFFFNK